jgi:DnaJ-domain-containing protein 1
MISRLKDILRAELNDFVFEKINDFREKQFQTNFENIDQEYQAYEESKTYDQKHTQQNSEPVGIEKHFRALELDSSADWPTIKKKYRTLMKLYHPDRFAHDPKKLAVAQKVSLELNEAYAELEKYYANR